MARSTFYYYLKHKDKLPDNLRKRAEHFYTEFERVLKGIALAQKENKVRLKINVVPVYGLDEKEIVSMVRFFDSQVPIYFPSRMMVTSSEILRISSILCEI